MARAAAGMFGYNPSELPTGSPGEFDDEQAQIQRRRAQLQALMNTPVGGAGSGLAGGVANFLTGMLGQHQLAGMDKQEHDLARRRSDAAEAAIASMPRDRPGVQEVIGTGPVAPPPGTPGVEPGGSIMDTPEPGPNAPAAAYAATPQPSISPAGWVGAEGTKMIPQGADFVPNRAGMAMIPAKVEDWAAWAARNAGLSPMMSRVAEKGLDLAMAAPEKRAALEATLQAKREANQAAYEEKRAAAEEKRTQEEKMYAYKAADAEKAAADRAADKEFQIRLMQAGRAPPAEKGTTDIGYDVETGRPVVRTADGSRRRIGPDGTPEGKPFTGEIMTTAAKEKETAKAMEVREHLGNVNDLLKQAQTNTGAFGSAGALLGLVPGPAGAWLSSANLTQDQRKARAEFAAQGAAITHDLYGSAFSSGEQQRAQPFIVNASDPPELVLSKMESMKKLADMKWAAKSGVARAAADARVGGGSGGKTVVKSMTKDGKTYVLYSDGSEGVQ